MNFYMLWLTKIFSGRYKELNNFLKLISPEDAYNLNAKELKKYNFTDVLKEKLMSQKIKDLSKYDFEFCQKGNINITNFKEDNYPHNLLNISSPPPLLYYKGTLLPKDEVSISIIGARKYSEYGKACTKKFASELVASKITVISGMAYGIDAFAHSYALTAGGRSIAVLGSGIDIIYPKENAKIYYDLIENGAVISEFPLHTAPISKNFPIRNRIVAGLSLGTLVIEANEKSGTMITARLAGEFGRNVYAVPGQIFSQSSNGTNQLIKDGAKLVTSSKDIIVDIYSEISQSVITPKQVSLFSNPYLSKEESLVYDKLSLVPTSIDNLVENIDLPLNEILATLSMLQLNGYINEIPGKQYVLNVT